MTIITAFVSHPVGGDVAANTQKIERVCGNIFKQKPEFLPLAPYLFALKFLQDDVREDRVRGISYNREFFARGFLDELWLFGDRISSGMWEEIMWAREFKIPVIPMTRTTGLELIKREISEGDEIQVQTCGPGFLTIGKFISFIPEDIGVYVETPAVGLSDLWWGDIITLAPSGVPIHSPKRLALQ
jgi:hypothetical protein